MNESPSWDQAAVEQLHQKLKAPSVFTILGIEQTYDKYAIHEALKKLKKEVSDVIRVLPDSHPYRVAFPGRVNEIYSFIQHPLQTFILQQAESMGVDLSDTAARDILESKYLEENVPLLLKNEKYMEAFPLAKRFVELMPEDPQALATLYTAQVFCSGSIEVQKEAILSLMSQAENNINSVELQLYAASAALHLNKREQAKGCIVRAENIAKNDPRVAAMRERISQKPKAEPTKAKQKTKRSNKKLSQVEVTDTTAIKMVVATFIVILITWFLALPMGMASQEPQYEISHAFWLIRRLILIGAAFTFYFFVFEKKPTNLLEDVGTSTPPLATPVAIALGIVLGLTSEFVPTGSTSLNVLGAFFHSAAYSLFFWGLLNYCFVQATGHSLGGVLVTSLLVGIYHLTFPTIVGLDLVWIFLWIGQYILLMGILPGVLWYRGGETIVPPFAYCLTINLVIIFKGAI